MIKGLKMDYSKRFYFVVNDEIWLKARNYQDVRFVDMVRK